MGILITKKCRRASCSATFFHIFIFFRRSRRDFRRHGYRRNCHRGFRRQSFLPGFHRRSCRCGCCRRNFRRVHRRSFRYWGEDHRSGDDRSPADDDRPSEDGYDSQGDGCRPSGDEIRRNRAVWGAAGEQVCAAGDTRRCPDGATTAPGGRSRGEWASSHSAHSSGCSAYCRPC